MIGYCFPFFASGKGSKNYVTKGKKTSLMLKGEKHDTGR